ncbi:uncharacterized protein METZ01_LOCUS89921, partial [marine metagenome]
VTTVKVGYIAPYQHNGTLKALHGPGHAYSQPATTLSPPCQVNRPTGTVSVWADGEVGLPARIMPEPHPQLLQHAVVKPPGSQMPDLRA